MNKRRLWIIGAIAVGAIVLLTLLAAPANQKLNSGSTYARTPDGYGAWYAFMSQRGTPVQRWQKPFANLAERRDIQPPMTLLRVYSRLRDQDLPEPERDWVAKGNTLVILGVDQPVTAAPFTSLLDSPNGKVKIATGRRQNNDQGSLLGDRFGAVVWQQGISQGRVIYSTTPYLAANAYQDFQSNYEFLARLVSQSGTIKESGANSNENPVFVDEYIHGYKDKEVIEREDGENVLSYLAKTPLFPAFVQGLILLLVVIWAGNRRFGKPVTLSTPKTDNSEAYIQALASVLQKANSSNFVVDVVGKEEQLQLQKALFLGEAPLDDQSLINAWVQQTGYPAAELEQLLQSASGKPRMSETDLLLWLEKWEQIRRLVH